MFVLAAWVLKQVQHDIFDYLMSLLTKKADLPADLTNNSIALCIHKSTIHALTNVV